MHKNRRVTRTTGRARSRRQRAGKERKKRKENEDKDEGQGKSVNTSLFSSQKRVCCLYMLRYFFIERKKHFLRFLFLYWIICFQNNTDQFGNTTNKL